MRSTPQFDLVLHVPQGAGRCAAQAPGEGERATGEEHRQFEAAARRREVPEQSAGEGGGLHPRASWTTTKRSSQESKRVMSRSREIEIVRCALGEDIGSGDVTTSACVPRSAARERPLPRARAAGDRRPRAAAADLRLRGGVDELDIFKQRRRRAARPATCVATVRGRARTLLECERVALNFLQRLSGVATLARRFADAVAGTGCRVLDTRKTTPGLRAARKNGRRAAGGVTNHRMGLYDAILIKNNHIAAAGGVRAASNARERAACRSKSKSARAPNSTRRWTAGAAHLLLDNLTPAEAAEWIRRDRRAAPRWNSPAASRSKPCAPTPKPAPTSSPPAPSRIRPAPSTSTSAWSWNDRHRPDPDACPGPRIDYYATIDSTMTEPPPRRWHPARWWSPTSRPPDRDGTAALALRSRRGLYCSIVLRASDRCLDARARARRRRSDRFSHGHRLRPALAERPLLGPQEDAPASWCSSTDAQAIAGIGINVNHTAFPPELEAIATRCARDRTHRLSREQLAARTAARQSTLLSSEDAPRPSCGCSPAHRATRPAAASSSSSRADRSTGTTAGLDPVRLPDRAQGRWNRDPDSCRRCACCSLLTQATATSPSARSKAAELVCRWRLRTVHEQTADEWGILLRNLFSPAGLDLEQGRRHHHLRAWCRPSIPRSLHGRSGISTPSRCSSPANRHRPEDSLR